MGSYRHHSKLGRWAVSDCSFDSALDDYLLFGPSLLDILHILRKREPDALPCEEGSGEIQYYDAPVGAPREVAYINTGTRTIWVAHNRPLFSESLKHIKQVWSSWRVHEHFEGLGRQAALSGRDPALVAAPEGQIETELIDDLMHDHDSADTLQVKERRAYLTTLLRPSQLIDRGGNPT